MRTARKFIAGLSSLICMSMFLAGCASEDGIYHPGSYTASAAGYAGDVMVEVEFDSEKILSVTILEHNETPTVADKAIEEIPDQIVEQQTSEVDVVTSATLTSEAIKTAVEDCIRQAIQG